MAQSKIYALGAFPDDAINILRQAPVDFVLDPVPQQSNWHVDANGLLVRSTARITASDIAKARKLKVIVKQGVGLDNIDLAAARQAGVAVYNTPGLNSEAVAELTLTLALCIARRVPGLDRRLRRGETLLRAEGAGQSLFGKTIGLVGTGNIARHVAQKWLGTTSGRVVAYNPRASAEVFPDIPHTRVDTLEGLLDISDVVSLHLPLTEVTRNLIGRPQLERMKSSAILINTARGGIVDESALLEALRSKSIYSAALDATTVEPPTPARYEALLENENIIITPHVGASTDEAQSATGRSAANILLQVLAGHDAPNRVA